MLYEKELENKVTTLLRETPLPMGVNKRINNLLKALKRGNASEAHKGELVGYVATYSNAPRCQGLR